MLLFLLLLKVVDRSFFVAMQMIALAICMKLCGMNGLPLWSGLCLTLLTWYQTFFPSPLFPSYAWQVSPGNHEHSSGQPILPDSENFNAFNYRFRMPSHESGAPKGS